jgi:hypothetical protein
MPTVAVTPADAISANYRVSVTIRGFLVSPQLTSGDNLAEITQPSMIEDRGHAARES